MKKKTRSQSRCEAGENILLLDDIKISKKKRKKNDDEKAYQESQVDSKNIKFPDGSKLINNPKQEMKNRSEKEGSSHIYGTKGSVSNRSDNEKEDYKKEYEEDSSNDEESDISADESVNSESSFNIDSYPSDEDEDEEMEEDKRGIPFNAEPSVELEEKEKRTVFVGNLPKTVERKDLYRWFSKFGRVQCVRLRSAPVADLQMPRKVAVIKKEFHKDRMTINAYIRFVNVEGAGNALQANGAKYGCNTLIVDKAKHEGGYDMKKGVFVGNLSFGIEEQLLIDFFEKCGEIENVRTIRDRLTGVGKGFAYVNFKCSSAVPLALKLDGEILEKRQIRVKPINYKRKHTVKPVFKVSQSDRSKVKNFRFKKTLANSKINQEHLKETRIKQKLFKQTQTTHNSNAVKRSNYVSEDLTKSGTHHKQFKRNEKASFASKKHRFQGEFSKRKERKHFKKMSSAAKQRLLNSKIFQRESMSK